MIMNNSMMKEPKNKENGVSYENKQNKPKKLHSDENLQLLQQIMQVQEK